MGQVQRSKAEIVAAVLERIAEDQHTVGENGKGGEVITIFDSQMPDQTTGKLKWQDAPFGPGDSELIKDGWRYIQSRLATGRETIRKPDGFEDLVDLENCHPLREHLSSFYARRLGKQFCKIIDRAEQLPLLLTHYDVPNDVGVYMEEASKCYLQGLFIACLMICRSTIEFAVRDRLKTLGHSSQLESFEKSDNGDSLKHLIELVQRLLPWQFKLVFEAAQKVREAARRAVHMSRPDDEECRKMFLLTRDIVHALYVEPETTG
jgi:hypothetical protein